MFNILCNLLMQSKYIEAGGLFGFIFIITMIFLYNIHRLAIVVYKSSKSKINVVLTVVAVLIIFLILLLGLDFYKLVEKAH